jgi:hypothetical protein
VRQLFEVFIAGEYRFELRRLAEEAQDFRHVGVARRGARDKNPLSDGVFGRYRRGECGR